MATEGKKIPTISDPFHKAPEGGLKTYTGNIVSVTAFEGQPTVNILLGVKTVDGQGVKQRFVRFKMNYKLAEKLKLQKGWEIGLDAEGRSKDSISNLPPDEVRGLNGAPIYALNGVDESTVKVTISRETATEEDVLGEDDWEDAKRSKGAIARAIDFLTGKGEDDKVKAAKKQAAKLF